MKPENYASLMNNTRWEEIRIAMDAINPVPSFRTCCVDNGYISNWDHDWLYHFPIGGYECIEWLEILCDTAQSRDLALAALRKIHVPGIASSLNLVVYGYAKNGQAVDYL